MIRAGRGVVALSIDAPGATPTRLTVHDQAGRVVVRRRLLGLRHRVSLPAGRLRLTLEDDRPLHDARRHGSVDLDVEVVADQVVEHTLTLVRGPLVRVALTDDGEPVRFARVEARHADGEHLVLRGDAHGGLVLAGLRPGRWTLQAHDAGYRRVARPAHVDVVAGGLHPVEIDLDQISAQALVHLQGAGREVHVPAVTLTHHATGHTVTAPAPGGVVDVRGLLPGSHTLHVPASLGHLPLDVVLDGLAPGGLGVAQARLSPGALLTGRVVRGGLLCHAAVVCLLDAEGRELERVRTDAAGRYTLGRGLRSTEGLTVVATSGPETLHVTRAARADVGVVTGVRHGLGDLVLPSAGRDAVWAPRTRTGRTMRLPSTRI